MFTVDHGSLNFNHYQQTNEDSSFPDSRDVDKEEFLLDIMNVFCRIRPYSIQNQHNRHYQLRRPAGVQIQGT